MGDKHAAAARFDESSAVNSDDPRLVAAVRDYMAALERGPPPNRKEFLVEHAEIAADLAVCLDGLEMVHSAATKVRRQPAPRPLLGAENTSQPLGDFQIVREIGRGGMGVVYEAYQLSLGRRVALKVLPFAASLDPARLERFRNEAQAAAQLHHTNIVPVYSVGIDRGVHFYAMQLIEGQALSDSIRDMRRAAGRTSGPDASATEPMLRSSSASSGASVSARRSVHAAHAETRVPGSTLLSEERANPGNYFRTVARLMQQAATALEHAHMMGVVHRDIKPGNLLLDKRGNLWVTDFGLAQFHTDAELTRTGDLLGTLRYMSPEQATGGRVLLDHRTDIYSLGATMYEVLTLEPIFDCSDRNILLRRIVENDPQAPRGVDKNIPLELETIVLKATAKAPADRYATAQQFADDLQRWLDDKPILARRPALAERMRRWRRRHRTVVRAATIVCFLGVLGLAAGAVIIAREHAHTAAAYKSEIKQRAAAEESFRQARQAIDTFTQLSEEELANKPALHQLRRKFLEKSLEYYGAFLKQRGSDPTLSSELTAASQRVARIVEELALLDRLAPLMLLYEPGVQDELNIPADRRSQMESLLTQLSEERERARSSNRSSQESQPASVTEDLRSHGEKLFALLSPRQLGRLKQIAWQQQGAQAFKSPDIIAALHLTPDEQKQINRIVEERRPPGPSERRRDPSDRDPPAERIDLPARGGPGHDGPGRDGRGNDDPEFDGPRHNGPERDGPGFGGPGFEKPPGRDGPRHDGPLGSPPLIGSEPDFDEPPDRRGGEPKGSSRERQTVEKILDILTPEQRIAWKNLVGAPFVQNLHGPQDHHRPLD
jgi:eukaryotic-like serine/threonine-protein kinase